MNTTKISRNDYALTLADACVNYRTVMNGAMLYYNPYSNEFDWRSTLTPNTGEIDLLSDVQVENFGGDENSQSELFDYFSDASHPQSNDLWYECLAKITDAFEEADDQEDWIIAKEEAEADE